MQFFCSANGFFFGVPNKFFGEQENKVQTFAASLPPFGAFFDALWLKFCHLMAQVLPLYVASFAALWRKFSSVLVPSTWGSTKVCCIFFGRGGEVCVYVEVSLRTACCCQNTQVQKKTLKSMKHLWRTKYYSSTQMCE
jgi:hypothetical protein